MPDEILENILQLTPTVRPAFLSSDSGNAIFDIKATEKTKGKKSSYASSFTYSFPKIFHFLARYFAVLDIHL